MIIGPFLFYIVFFVEVSIQYFFLSWNNGVRVEKTYAHIKWVGKRRGESSLLPDKYRKVTKNKVFRYF